MKNLKGCLGLFSVFLFAFMLIAVVIPVAISQTIGGETASILPELPESSNPADYFSTFLLFAATIMVLTNFVNKIINLTGYFKQYLSWVIAAIVGFAAHFMGWGIFAPPAEWYQVLTYILVFGLASNGFYDWKVAQAVVDFITFTSKNKKQLK
jgi:nicotinamide riboside transporter PnuC